MEQVEIEITGLTVSTQYGTLTQGDVLRVSREYASHLVKDARAAKYVNAKDADDAKVAADVQPAAKPSEEPPVIVKKGAAKAVSTDAQTTTKASAGVISNPSSKPAEAKADEAK
jgi:hypothetical protein